MLPNRAGSAANVDKVPKAPRRRDASSIVGDVGVASNRATEPPGDDLSPCSTEKFIQQRLREKMIASLSHDSALREMLRKGLSLLEQDEIGTAATFAETATLPQSTIGVEVEDGGASLYSDLSNVTGGVRAQATMDIYHPDFWNAYFLETSSSDASAQITAADSSRDTSGKRCGSNSSRCRSLNAFLHQRNNEISSSDSERVDDECSVLSDLTGLTDAFEHETTERSRGKKRREHGSAGSPSPHSGSDMGSSHGNSFASSARHQTRRVVDYSVRFSDVNVRHYERIISDNPACRIGPGIGIGWAYEEAEPVALDEWEEGRLRARKSALALSRSQREKIIRSLGYTDRDIAATVRELNRMKYNRRQTVNNLGLEQIEMTLEMAKRNVKNAILAPLRGKR